MHTAPQSWAQWSAFCWFSTSNSCPFWSFGPLDFTGHCCWTTDRRAH